jgi:hypothetical protein
MVQEFNLFKNFDRDVTCNVSICIKIFRKSTASNKGETKYITKQSDIEKAQALLPEP